MPLSECSVFHLMSFFLKSHSVKGGNNWRSNAGGFWGLNDVIVEGQCQKPPYRADWVASWELCSVFQPVPIPSSQCLASLSKKPSFTFVSWYGPCVVILGNNSFYGGNSLKGKAKKCKQINKICYRPNKFIENKKLKQKRRSTFAPK